MKTRAWGRRVAAAAVASALLVTVAPAASAAEVVVLEQGDSGSEVAALQRMLAARGFFRGPADGAYDSRTAQAVMAFHKEIGAERTFSWKDTDWGLLARYDGPWLPHRMEGERVEINITRQVLYLVKGGVLTAIVPISSGNEELYRTSSGGWARAHTPRGDFTFRRYIDGWRESSLGLLYKPWYFVGGYALHGSPSVPAWPASHGCVRVPMWEAEYLSSGQLWLGMPVHVWDAPAGTGPSFLAEPDAALYAGPFVDDEGSIHEGDIARLAEMEVTRGCGLFAFCPKRMVTRGEMAAFVRRGLRLPDGPDAFGDDQGHRFEADINALAAREITNGCGEGRFCPDELVSRGETAGFLRRALELPDATSANPFWDDNGTMFERDINALVEAGIAKGCADQQFCPEAALTREQMASFLVRAFRG